MLNFLQLFLGLGWDLGLHLTLTVWQAAANSAGNGTHPETEAVHQGTFKWKVWEICVTKQQGFYISYAALRNVKQHGNKLSSERAAMGCLGARALRHGHGHFGTSGSGSLRH